MYVMMSHKCNDYQCTQDPDQIYIPNLCHNSCSLFFDQQLFNVKLINSKAFTIFLDRFLPVSFLIEIFKEAILMFVLYLSGKKGHFSKPRTTSVEGVWQSKEKIDGLLPSKFIGLIMSLLIKLLLKIGSDFVSLLSKRDFSSKKLLKLGLLKLFAAESGNGRIPEENLF
ncbi:hypothetical protein BpHYR1_000838 [Brachionus plicatilis]|uniref:Uncharacterized protein n=1 Tax=Brachionus plicatilis TaxID=10195 RepID=A0A3M7RBC8_BRAPC|nr:hypothetical protein BpHYR1_000838 [Brachionus plicatilis]